MKSFQTFLEEQKKTPTGKQLKEKVNIATAGSTFFQKYILENKLGQSRIQRDEISKAAIQLTDEFRDDIEQLDNTDYRGFVSFIRKFETVLKELEGNRSLSPEDRQYVEDVIREPLTQIGSIKGATLRTAYALEEVKKQFKPLKLADTLFGDLPIIGNIIKGKIEDIEAGEESVRKAGLRAARQAAVELRKKEGIEEDTGEFEQGTPTGGDIADITSDITQERAADEGRPELVTPTTSFRKSEESQKEAATQREETQNIFEAIMANTAETNEILKELTEAYKDENEGIGEILDVFGNPIAAGATGAAAAVGGTALAKKAFGKSKTTGATKTATPKGSKLKANVKKASQVVKTGAKGFISKVPWLLPVITAYDVVSGFANADEILEAAPDEEVSFFDKLGAGLGKAAETFTFGLVDAKKAANFLGAEPEKIMQSVDASTSTNLGDMPMSNIGSAMTIDTDMVNLKANQIKLGTMENEMSKGTEVITPPIVNTNANTQVNNSTMISASLNAENNDGTIKIGRNSLY